MPRTPANPRPSSADPAPSPSEVAGISPQNQVDGPGPVPAGDFLPWLRDNLRARRSDAGVRVPCGSCRGCCTSFYFIAIAPDEKATLARIPGDLLFPAPGRPKGHMVMGYDEKGHCPMFVDGACSIYPFRPRTCRDYDCRVFAATDVPVDEGQPAIGERARSWAFAFPSAEDKERWWACRAAAKLLRGYRERFPPGFVPSHPTQQAVVALRVHGALLGLGADIGDSEPGEELVRAMVAAYGEPEARPRKQKRKPRPRG